MLLTARQAADRLGVKLDTLYAYVSRGRLRSVTVPGTRERRYRGEDVEALLGVVGGLPTRSGRGRRRGPAGPRSDARPGDPHGSTYSARARRQRRSRLAVARPHSPPARSSVATEGPGRRPAASLPGTDRRP